MNIYIIAITVILILIVVCGVMTGVRKGLKPSLLSLAANALAALAAFGIARLFAAAFGGPAAKFLSGRLASSMSSDAAGILELPEISVWAFTAGRVAVSVAAFMVFYLILFLLLKIPIRLLLRKRSDAAAEQKAPKAVSPILRVVSGVMTFILLLSPAVTLCGALDNHRIESYQYASAAPGRTLQTVADYPVVKAASAAGGRLFFNALTVFRSDGVQISPSDELGYAAEFAFNSYDIFSFDNTDLEETESSLLKIDEALNGSLLLAPSVGTIVPYMAGQWLDGKSFLGVSVEIPKGRFGIVVRKMLERISRWSAEDVLRDFRLLVELMNLLHNKNLSADLSVRELLNAFADKEYAKEIFVALNANEDLREMIPDIVYSGVGMILDEIGANLPYDYDADRALSLLTDEYAAKEAVIFSDIAAAVSDIYQSNDSIRPSSMTDGQKLQLKEAVEEIKNSRVLDEDTSQSVVAALDEAFSKLR